MLEVAKANAETFALIGTTQRFDEFVLLARERFGWRKVSYLSRNVRTDRPKATIISATTNSAPRSAARGAPTQPPLVAKIIPAVSA